jgi:hypothetical protein
MRWKAPSPPSWRASICASTARRKGRQIACALLEDLMEAGPLKAAASLSFLGLAVMDELAPVISQRLCCTEGKNNENERNGNRKPGVRPLAAHSPGAG